MENPHISQQLNFLVISKRTKELYVQIDGEGSLPARLVCRFLEQDKNLYAAVIAPIEEQKLLVHRIVSFVGAYMQIADCPALEKEILRCISDCLHKHYHY